MKINDLQHEQLQEFYVCADKFGHDLAVLQAGEEICTYITIPTLSEAGRILTHLNEAQRKARAANFFNTAVAARRRLGQGVHDRGEASVITGSDISEHDLQGLSNHLPLRAKVVSVLHKTVRAGEIWDVSVRGEVWDLDDREELYVGLNIGTLVLEPGASVAVQGNVLSFLCQKIIAIAPANPAQNYQEQSRIAILPTPFSVDFSEGPLHGVPGKAGENGENGSDGKPLRLAQSLLGKRLQQPLDEATLDGTPGTNGGPGQAGTKGRNGGMAKLADIILRSVEGLLLIFAQAGQGGAGGHGGQGGVGGDGGNGAAGAKVIAGLIAGGRGGVGGTGGQGGNGGNGGNGGIASNIFLIVPPGDEAKVKGLALPSEPGSGGQGGAGGSGGNGGRGGDGPDEQHVGVSGSSGQTGASGLAGRAGRGRPAPAIFLNEKLLEMWEK